MKIPNPAAARDALAIITCTTDSRLARQMWQSREASEWDVVHALADVAGAAIQVLAECQGREEAEVLADLGIQVAP